MFGRRGATGWLDYARPVAGTVPATRLLQGRRVRRGRTSHLRSLLLRWHVDKDEGDLAGADAGSGSHNFDAPTWRAKDVGGNRLPRTPMGTEPLTGSAGGGGRTKSGSRRCSRGILPSFGPQG